MIYLELFWSFFQVGLFCVGGGYASMPLIQAQVIDIHGWLTMSEFIDIFAISQMTPGPIGINAATFVGTKMAGVCGAIAATAGFAAPSLLIMLTLAHIVFKYGELGAIKGILNGLRPSVVALIAAAGISFLQLALHPQAQPSPDAVNVGNAALILLATLALHYKKAGPIQILLITGVLNLAFKALLTWPA